MAKGKGKGGTGWMDGKGIEFSVGRLRLLSIVFLLYCDFDMAWCFGVTIRGPGFHDMQNWRGWSVGKGSSIRRLLGIGILGFRAVAVGPGQLFYWAGFFIPSLGSL